MQLSDDEDDYEFLADGELGEAPSDPGTYEGGHAKPASSIEFPNKWCVRECERCNMSDVGKFEEPLEVLSFDKRRRNCDPPTVEDLTRMDSDDMLPVRQARI